MTTPKAITVHWLEEHRACEDQIEEFRRVFGDQAELTRDNASLAVSAGLNLDWLAKRLLLGASQRTYKEARAMARRAYEEAIAPSRRAFFEATATARRVYAETSSLRAFFEAMAMAQRAYDEAQAEALCDQLGLPEEE